MLTRERVLELLFVYPEEGTLYWKRSPNKIAGSICVCMSGAEWNIRRRRRVQIDGKIYPASSIMWLVKHGVLPDHILDHKNRDPSDDRIENLREATRVQNLGNTGRRRNNRSGFKGVRKTRSGKYTASINTGGQIIRLGRFTEAEDAARAYDAAAKEYLGEFAYLNFPDGISEQGEVKNGK